MRLAALAAAERFGLNGTRFDGVAVDEVNNRAIVADSLVDTIFVFDLSGGAAGNGPAFVQPQAMTLDHANNRALLIDFVADTWMEVDLACP